MKFHHGQSTLVAKALYAVGGLLSRIQVPTRMYEWDPETGEFTRLAWQWFSWSVGYRIALDWSPEWDHKHWDHWALDHANCGGTYCIGCKGRVCGHYEHQ